MKQKNIKYDFTKCPELIYDCDFDESIKDILFLFNKLGLRTEYSCEGHKGDSSFYIAFDESVTDKQIRDVIQYAANSYDDMNRNPLMLGFNRYMRAFNKHEMRDNWVFRCSYTSNENKESKMKIVEKILEKMVIYNGVISTH